MLEYILKYWFGKELRIYKGGVESELKQKDDI